MSVTNITLYDIGLPRVPATFLTSDYAWTENTEKLIMKFCGV